VAKLVADHGEDSHWRMLSGAGTMEDMSATPQEPTTQREPILGPVERVSEMLFGLFMAVTFVGAISAASPSTEIRAMFWAALGCNLAWGLVDAVMYLVRNLTERGKTLSLALAVRSAPDAETGRQHVERALSKVAAKLISPAEIEAIRARIVALPELPKRPSLDRRDALAGLAIFCIVVLATFPVVLPYLLISDVDTAKIVSRVLTLSMLFAGGLALGRYAGTGSLRVGFSMMALGTAVIVAIMALGG
jgi:hypothetical protein